ncbi:L,D-transpeptidase family protein [Knoellia koreensis]|nr:L,D-transpeptidase family protein [Knoellia sp. DB2414S]
MDRKHTGRVGTGVAGALALTLLLGACGVSLGGGSSTDGGQAGGMPSSSSSSSAPAPSETTTEPAQTATSTTTPPAGTTTKPAPTKPSASKPPAKPSRTTTTAPKPTTKPTPRPTPKPTNTTPKPPPQPQAGDTLKPGDDGAYVQQVQQRLNNLGYWNGAADGSYGQLTSQAVMALQKAAGIGRDGVFGPATARALENGVRPASRVGGTGIEIDKARQLLLVVRGGRVTMILNTSTGSNQPYKTKSGGTAVATTPAGSFQTFRSVDGMDRAPLGDLWRPRYFNGGIAVHGSTSIPGYPASHGCARVSNAAMDMIWANGLMPIGGRVTVY